MEIALFYALCGAVWACFRFTTPLQRQRALRSFWTLHVIGFVIGFVLTL